MQIVIDVTKEDIERASAPFDYSRGRRPNNLVRNPIAFATRRVLEEVLGEANTDIGIEVCTKQMVVGNRKKKTPLQDVALPEDVVAIYRHYKKTGEMQPFTLTLDLPV